jgi:hypothetical protein
MKLQATNTAVGQAFNAVLEAEKAGANVTALSFQLNEAAGVLAQAENSYRTGDFNTASAQADSVLPVIQEVSTSALNAKQTAVVSSRNAIWSSMTYTIIGILIFVLTLFLTWRWFKKRYIKNLLR